MTSATFGTVEEPSLVVDEDVSGRLRVGNTTLYCGPENQLLRQAIVAFEQFLLSAEDIPLLFLFYGIHGSGKSMTGHLVAELWKCYVKPKSVIFTTATDFRRTLNDAVKTDDFERCYQLYSSASLVVLDDVHHLTGKAAAQHWLARLIDDRACDSRPLILTCRNPINREQKLIERLKSRIADGLSVAVRLPGLATRRAIIEDAISTSSLKPSPADIDRLAASTDGLSVSEVQTAVKTLNLDISPEQLRSELLTSTATNAELHSDLSRQILRETAKRFGTLVRDLEGSSRRKSVVVPRAVAMFLIRELTGISLMKVGQYFRKRDHSTVLHACQKIQKQLPEDPFLRETLINILEALNVPTPTDWLSKYWKSGGE